MDNILPSLGQVFITQGNRLFPYMLSSLLKTVSSWSIQLFTRHECICRPLCSAQCSKPLQYFLPSISSHVTSCENNLLLVKKNSQTAILTHLGIQMWQRWLAKVQSECQKGHCTVANIININTTHSSASSYMKPDFPSSFNLSLCPTGAEGACRLISPGVGRLRGSDMETVTLNNGAKMPLIGLGTWKVRPNISNFNLSPRIWWAMFFFSH